MIRANQRVKVCPQARQMRRVCIAFAIGNLFLAGHSDYFIKKILVLRPVDRDGS
jgi:hypothetical protein